MISPPEIISYFKQITTFTPEHATTKDAHQGHSETTQLSHVMAHVLQQQDNTGTPRTLSVKLANQHV